MIKEKIKSKLINIKPKYPNTAPISDLIQIIIGNLDAIVTPMPFAMHHGDYFHGNYFIDIKNRFRVFDWEFAKEDEWVIIDPLFNLMNIHHKLQKINKVNSLHSILKNPSKSLIYIKKSFEMLNKYQEILRNP